MQLCHLSQKEKVIKSFHVRGTVRYVGEEKESNGFVHTIVGLELVSTYIK